MTDRALTSAMAQAVQAAVVRPVILYEGLFAASGSPSEQALRMWTGLGTLSWNGYTWAGGGDLLAISPLEETARIESVGFTVTLSGMPSDKISLALQSVRQGKPGRLYLGLMEPSACLTLPGVAGNYASTPDSAALDITGDIDIRVQVALDDWTPENDHTFVAKRDGFSDISYRFGILSGSGGFPALVWSSNGSSETTIFSSAATGFTDGSVHWLRATLAVDAGSPSGYEVRFYTSDDGIEWTQLGATRTGVGATALFSSTSTLEVGAMMAGTANLVAGKIYRAKVYSGIAGTLVADFDARRFVGGGLTAQMTTGETWTISQNAAGSPSFLPARITPEGDQLLADPYQLEEGRFDISIIQDDGETCTIQAQYESRLVDLLKPRVRRYTDEDQKIDYPTDTGFSHVAALQDAVLIWGGPAAASAPLAQPNAGTSFGSGGGDHEPDSAGGGSFWGGGEDNRSE